MPAPVRKHFGFRCGRKEFIGTCAFYGPSLRIKCFRSHAVYSLACCEQFTSVSLSCLKIELERFVPVALSIFADFAWFALQLRSSWAIAACLRGSASGHAITNSSHELTAGALLVVCLSIQMLLIALSVLPREFNSTPTATAPARSMSAEVTSLRICRCSRDLAAGLAARSSAGTSVRPFREFVIIWLISLSGCPCTPIFTSLRAVSLWKSSVVCPVFVLLPHFRGVLSPDSIADLRFAC